MDNENTGAAWVFRRRGGVWSQQGPKLVGTGGVGNGWQGTSVALSSDGNTAIIGGIGDVQSDFYPYLNTGATWVFVDLAPKIASVNDLPFDQGGIAMVNWNHSVVDEAFSSKVTHYWIWRGIRAAAAPPQAMVVSRRELASRILSNEPGSEVLTIMNPQIVSSSATGEIYWQYIASVPSHALMHYSYPCPTLADSVPQGIP
jgi:hypothetical protein